MIRNNINASVDKDYRLKCLDTFSLKQPIKILNKCPNVFFCQLMRSLIYIPVSPLILFISNCFK